MKKIKGGRLALNVIGVGKEATLINVHQVGKLKDITAWDVGVEKK